MTEENKGKLLTQARAHVSKVSEDIKEQTVYVESSIKSLRETIRKGMTDDPEVLMEILQHRIESKQHLEYSFNTPYFVRCDVKFDDESEEKTLYFGRFPFTKDCIYSWVAPAAAIRFDSPGRITYTLPDGNERSGQLLRKDQYMIVDQKLLFMSTESIETPRDLVYQEHFSQEKRTFVLPEIVEQMEKAQDKIIRSHYYGSFLISGAAGSGKTTLALHRVAYLVQSPETSPLFQPKDIIVFVQDQSTKRYFGDLLPTLGINNVKITTFDEWAMKLLNITDMQFVRRYGTNEIEKDEFEYAKRNALEQDVALIKGKDVAEIVEQIYKKYLTKEQVILLKKQLKESCIDRFDLTMLLKHRLQKDSVFMETVDKYIKNRTTRKYVKKRIQQQIQYSLMIVDEAENYLAQQIQILKKCIQTKTNAIIYVGDLVQRTLPWTMSDWQQVHEFFEESRKVSLQKVYRNTRQILEYIAEVGFSVEIPSSIRQGDKITEIHFQKKTEEIAYVEQILKETSEKMVGIVAKTEEYLSDYKKHFSQMKNVHVLTINEAQGVEFDTVILVGVNKELYQQYDTSKEVSQERKRVDRDLLYVALTRAINTLYVCGEISLKTLLAS